MLHKKLLESTRFGPNRVAADMEGNGECEFGRFFLENFLRIFGKFLPAAKPTGLVEASCLSFFFLLSKFKKRA